MLWFALLWFPLIYFDLLYFTLICFALLRICFGLLGVASPRDRIQEKAIGKANEATETLVKANPFSISSRGNPLDTQWNEYARRSSVSWVLLSFTWIRLENQETMESAWCDKSPLVVSSFSSPTFRLSLYRNDIHSRDRRLYLFFDCRVEFNKCFNPNQHACC